MARKRNNRKNPMATYALVIAVLFLVAGPLAIYAMGGSIYRGGWETTTTLSDITVDNQMYNIRNQPEDTLSWGAFECSFDADGDGSAAVGSWEGHGLPDITMSLTFPREYVINDYGEWQTAIGGDVFDEVVKKVSEDTIYFWDHHVFFFEFSITCEPEGIPVLFANPEGEGYQNGFSNVADIAARINFQAEDWLGRIYKTIELEGMSLQVQEDSVWSGVMSASVYDYEINLAEDYLTEGYVDVKTKGAINTFYPDSYTTSDSISFYDGQETSPIAGVPDSIDMEFSCRLSPGHSSDWFTYDPGFCSVKWRARVDVLTTAGYKLETGNIDDYLNAEGSHRSGTNVFGEAFFRALGSPFAFLGLDYEGGVIVFIFLVLIILIIIIFMVKAVKGGPPGVGPEGEDMPPPKGQPPPREKMKESNRGKKPSKEPISQRFRKIDLNYKTEPSTITKPGRGANIKKGAKGFQRTINRKFSDLRRSKK